nr:hypothetical protein [uncultured Flavobacterium sp.]
MSNFIEDCIAGDALVFEVHDYIDAWHDGESEQPLFEFLGMDKHEYTLFVQDESYLPLIIAAHKNKQSIKLIVHEQIALAARADSHSKAQRLEEWLRNENLWE